MNCPECDGRAVTQDSHWEWLDPVTKVDITYYECTDCGHEFAEKGDPIATSY